MHVDTVDELFDESANLFSQMKQFPSQFKPQKVLKIAEKIGQGSFGSVYRCYLTGSPEKEFAIKEMRFETDKDLKNSKLMNEINILRECSSPYIVSFHECCTFKRKIWVVMEYCQGGSVSDLMRICKKQLTEAQISAICACVTQGVAYLHEQKIFHRDIKAGNILLARNAAKLADFGVSTKLNNISSKRRSLVGSAYWMAPEVMVNMGNGYDIRADIWSLGITALEMADTKPPLSEIHHEEVIYIIPECPAPTFKNPEQWSDDFKDFVNSCLQKDPEKRYTAQELLKHPFIRAGSWRLMELANLLDECIPILEDFRYEADIDSGNWFESSTGSVDQMKALPTYIRFTDEILSSE